MNPRLRSILVAIGILTFAILAIVLIPRGLSLYYQSRGGQHIDYVLRSVEGIEELVCEQLPDSNESAIEEVNSGLADLEQAVRFNQNNAQAHYYLGKAYCLLGEPEAAVESYRTYTGLRPDNPLGYLESGFGYLSKAIKMSKEENGNICRMDGKQGNLENPVEMAASIFKESGIDGQQFFLLASENLSKGNFLRAACYLQFIEVIGTPQDTNSELIQNLLLVLIGIQSTEDNPVNLPGLKELSDHLSITPKDIYWIQPLSTAGKPLDLIVVENLPVGVMWWNGSAGLPIDVQDPGYYSITIQAEHSIPPPVKLVIEHNLQSVKDFSLSSGDMSWQELEAEVYLSQGIHLLSIKFINDGKENEIDRNAYIGWLHLDRK